MYTEPLFFLVGLATVFLISLSKGAFGGGLATIGIPMLSLVVAPIDAAIILAPLVFVMDLFAVGKFGPRTWSRPDLAWIAPGLLLGISIGYAFFAYVDPRFVNLGIGAIALLFVGDFFLRRRAMTLTGMPANPVPALAAGTASGFTTFVAHAGGPPLQMYLLRRGLDKAVYAGTTLAVFMLGNLVKLLPYGLLAWQRPQTMIAAALLVPAIPFGVWVGKVLHDRLEQQRLFFWAYVLLALTATKLFYDALRAVIG